MKKREVLIKGITMVLLVVLISACQSPGDASPGGQSGQPDGQQSFSTPPGKNPPAEPGKPYTVTDDLGNQVTFDQVPGTVVSLQPSNTEILFALGLGEKIVGVTEFDTYPEEARAIERVSDSVNINAERIVELDPDVVFAYTVGEKESIRPLLDAGIPVFVIRSASSFEEVYGDIIQIAEVMGVKEKGEALVREIRDQIEEVQEKVKEVEKPKEMYLEISPAPDIYTTGRHTFQHEILQKAGVENSFGDLEGWIKVSEEEVIKRNPDLIATTVHYAGPDPVEEIKRRPGWQELDAVRRGDVYLLDEEIMTRPGPRIGQAVELVARTAYPDLFK